MKYTHISSKHRLLDLRLKELWHYRDLIFMFVKRSFSVKYKQTILGPLWLFIKPMLSSLIYLFVFGNIAKFNTDGIPKVLFYFSGTAIWTFFSDCVTLNAKIFADNVNLFGKVYFPRLTMVIANVLSNMLKFAIQMIFVFGVVIYFLIKGVVHQNVFNLLLLFPILLELGLMGMGIGLILSSITTKYRDLTILLEFGMNLWMYASPVVYPLSQIEEGSIKNLIAINPVTAPIESFRYCLFGQGSLMPEKIIFSLIFTAVIAFSGLILFIKVERTFQDTV